MTRPRRKPIPPLVKFQVCLLAHGVPIETINAALLLMHMPGEWSHEPALELRAIVEGGADYDPPQHSIRHLFKRTEEQHDHITFKDNGTGRGDLTAIAVSRKVSDGHKLHQAAMAEKDGRHDEAAQHRSQVERKSRLKPTRGISSRGFTKGHRPLRSGNSLRRRT